MLLIIIGIVILIAGIIWTVKSYHPLPIIVGGIIFALLLSMGTGSISGYEEPIVEQEYELKPIYEPSVYIIEDSDGRVTCEHVIKNEHPEAIESYGKYTYNNNVEIVVTEKDTKPIMKKYYTKAKKTIFTFALDCDKAKYIFYVPEENIERWQNEHVY